MATIKLLYTCHDHDRHGNVRWYVRVPGKKKQRIYAMPGTEEFTSAYWSARNGETEPKPRVEKMQSGTFGYLVNCYYASDAFKALDEVYTQKERRRTLGPVVSKAGHTPAILTPKTIRDGLKRRKPGQAKKLMAALRHLYQWATEEEFVETNPTIGIRAKRAYAGGFATWTAEDRKKFEDHFPLGTQARTAYAIGLYLACRRSDAPRLGPRNEREKGTAITYTQHKNRNSKPVVMYQPIVKPLRAALDAGAANGFTYLQSERGQQFSIFSFGNKFHDWCVEAGLRKGLSFHGLRKATAAALAEGGATAAQIKAVLGHATTRMADTYTRDADQARLARDSLEGLYGEQIVPPVLGGGTKQRKKTR